MRMLKRIAGILVVALALPGMAHGVPVYYSFAGELTSFYSNLDGERTLESLGTRAITGTFSYDTDRQDTGDVYGVLRTSIAGEGFFFDAGEAGIEGSQLIRRTDGDVLDSLLLFEFYEYMLGEDSYVTREMTMELFGSDMLNVGVGDPNSILNASLFEYGSGVFGDSSYDPDLGVLRQSGAFNITALRREGIAVPEPTTVALLGVGLLMLAFARRRRERLLSAGVGR